MGEPLTPLIAAARAYVHALEMGLDTADEEAALLDAAAPAGETDPEERYRRVTESAQRDVANWPEWKRNPPTVPPAPVPAAGLREVQADIAERILGLPVESGRDAPSWNAAIHAAAYEACQPAALLDSDGLDVERRLTEALRSLDAEWWDMEYEDIAAALAARLREKDA